MCCVSTIRGGDKVSMTLINPCDKKQLTLGASCILEVLITITGSDTVFWWGQILAVQEEADDSIKVYATIHGGRVAFDESGKPITTNECEGLNPTSHFKVFPDTPTVRLLIARLITTRDIANRALEDLELLRPGYRKERAETGRY